MRALKTKIAQRRAPDDAEYAELTSWFSSFSKDVKDLEARVVAFNRAANSLIVEAERVALQSATLCGPVGVGRNGEYAGVKTQQSDHKQRFADVTEAFRALNTELRSVQQRIDERHLLGANMEKLKKKIEKLSEDDAKNVAQFEEANTAEDQYFAAHNDSLAELQLWRVKLAKMHLTPLHHQIKVMELSFFRVDAPPMKAPADLRREADERTQSAPGDADASSSTVAAWTNWAGGAIEGAGGAIKWW